MHIADFTVGMLGANGVVAAGLPIAVGAAHAAKLAGDGRIAACFFGDGAVNRGPFLEALNWAKVYALPVLFVCEDNKYSATTCTSDLSAGAGPLARAQSLGIHGATIDGNDVEAVDMAAADMIAKIRAGAGPQLPARRHLPHEGAHRIRPRPLPQIRRGRGAGDARSVAARSRAAGRARRRRQGDHRDRRSLRRARSTGLCAAKAAPWPGDALAYSDIQDTGFGQWR